MRKLCTVLSWSNVNKPSAPTTSKVFFLNFPLPLSCLPPTAVHILDALNMAVPIVKIQHTEKVNFVQHRIEQAGTCRMLVRPVQAACWSGQYMPHISQASASCVLDRLVHAACWSGRYMSHISQAGTCRMLVRPVHTQFLKELKSSF